MIEEIRGKGLLIGLKLQHQQPRVHGPGARREAADRRRRRQLRAPAAARCCSPATRRARRSRSWSAPARRRGAKARRRAMSQPPTAPLPRPLELDAADLRAILDDAKRAQGRALRLAEGPGRRRRAGRGPHAGDDLPEELDPHLVLVRRGDPPARRRLDHLHRRRHAARPRRDHRGHRQGALAHGRRGDDPRQPPRGRRGAGRGRPTCR